MNQNAKLLILLRWAAIGFQLIVLVCSIIFKLPINTFLLLGSISIQVLVNTLTTLFLKEKRSFSEYHFFFQLLFDLVMLTLFIFLSGGMANPFSGLFLVQAFLAALILSKRLTWVMIGLTSLSYALLLLFSNTSSEDHHRWMEFHLHGMALNHILTTIVVASIAYKIISNIKEKEKQIHSQKSLVSAGAFAAQMAHKLGTPLSIMALLAEDLNTETVDEKKEKILHQIFSCKDLLQRFFHRLSSLDSKNPVEQPFNQAKNSFFVLCQDKFPNLLIHWEPPYPQRIRPVGQELLFLLLEIFSENEFEAKATEQWIKTRFESERFELTLINNGPDLPDDVRALMMLGMTHNKRLPHTGMGLFLVRLILDSLNGDIAVSYQDQRLIFTVSFSMENFYE